MDNTFNADMNFFDNPEYYDKIALSNSDSIMIIQLLWNVLDLDPETEYNLFETIKNNTQNNIVIFTSHRLSNVHLVNHIIVLENGTIVEQGTLTELLNNKNRFAQLFEYQAEKYLF